MRFIAFLVLIIPNILFAQSCIDKEGRTFKIVFSELDHTVFPKQEIPFSDTLTKDGIMTIIKILDCKGKATFITHYSHTEKVKIKGSYSSSKALLKKHEPSQDLISGELFMDVGEFYEGLKDGDWIYYDKDGNLIKKEKYKEGILINSN